MKIEFNLNGQLQSVDVDPRENLLAVLREDLSFRGTKYGCGEGECGACTVLVNGQPVTSCLVLAGQVHGARIITIEGMEDDLIGQHIVSAFAEHGAVQCGYCIPGMIISARALLSKISTPTISEIQTALGGNLCRCTGYKKIIAAVQSAAELAAAEFHPPNGKTNGSERIWSKNFVRPENLEEALALLSNRDDWRLISGCTDFGVFHEHYLKDFKFIDLAGMAEISGVSEDEHFVRVGGGTTFTGLLGSQLIEKWAQPLFQAAREIGAIQIQNMATIAGNLVNASPAADAIPPLSVLGASVVLGSISSERIISISEFVTGPGETVIAQDEILVEVLIPKVEIKGEQITFFTKFGSRNAQTISTASLAMRGWREDDRLHDVSIAMGAVAPTVIAARKSAQYLMAGKLTEARLVKAGKIAAEACHPIDDLRASADYRRRLVQGLLVKNLWKYVQ